MKTAVRRVLVRLGRASSGMRLIPAEFDAVTVFDRRYRYELIHGVVVVAPIPADSQCSPNDYLGYLFYSYQENHPDGSALDCTMPERYVRLSDGRRLADRVLWAGLGRLPDTMKDVPTIAIEFVSRRKRDWLRDYEEKRKEYLAAGVKEYWIIDRFRRTLTVYTKRRGKVHEQVVKENETYRTDLLPGFELPPARILALADQWAKPKRKK
jgi:Uma2 family endonuclease